MLHPKTKNIIKDIIQNIIKDIIDDLFEDTIQDIIQCIIIIFLCDNNQMIHQQMNSSCDNNQLIPTADESGQMRCPIMISASTKPYSLRISKYRHWCPILC